MRTILFLLLSILCLSANAQQDPLKVLAAQIQKEGPAAKQHVQQKIISGKATGTDFIKAVLLLYGSNSEVAVNLLTAAIPKLSPQDPLYREAFRLRSEAYVRLVNIDSAIADLEKYHKLAPHDVASMINLSYLYGLDENYPMAIGLLQTALQSDSTNPNLYANLAYYHAEATQYDSAIYYGTQGMRFAKDPKLVGSILSSVGYAQGMSVSREKGMAVIRKSLEVYPDNSFAWFNIGRIYLSMNNRDEACEAFRRAKSLGGVNLTAAYLESFCQ
ncbi:MAG: tetratricopeptide repeat protein [Chitinophaga sp.]|uniref:tetratricopeptide repeat protein n=1 Tax=Chitinophaga sp. TaxID=1869181 RepID=UPI0025BA3B35|nr:tetratricopeptide repeat protein [Chitinophaga sp.]MBV8251775.1 tetratricopeptide repeat protein [Chitinophaga sp.]